MNLLTYFLEILEGTLASSKVSVIKKNLNSKFNFVNYINRQKDKRKTSNYLTKFHNRFYKNHILELAIDLSSEEQEVASEVLAEPEIEFTKWIDENNECETIEDLIDTEIDTPDYVLIPKEFKLIKIILMNGFIEQKVYENSKEEYIVVDF